MSLAKLNLENVVFQIVGKTLKIIDNPTQLLLTSNSTTNTKKQKAISENDKKFGEIYLSQDGRIYFNCEICNNNYFCIKYFTKHIIEEHNANFIQETIAGSSDVSKENETKKSDEDSFYQAHNELNHNHVILEDQDMQMETVIYEDDSDNQHYIEQIGQDPDNDITDSEVEQSRQDEILTNSNTTTTAFVYNDENVRIINDPSGNTYRIETVDASEKITNNQHHFQHNQNNLRKNANTVLVQLETDLLEDNEEDEYNDSQTIYTNNFIEENEPQEIYKEASNTIGIQSSFNFHNTSKRTFFDDLYDSFEYKKCKLCNVKTGQMLTHLKYKHPNAIKCNISDCNLPFDSEEEYIAHKAELHVHPNFPFQCKSCSYKCKYRSGILNHYNRIHLQKPKFQCNLCDKSFYAYHVRKRHVRECHGNSKIMTVVREIRGDASF